MLMIKCHSNTEGMRTGDRTITVRDANGKKEYLLLDPDYLVTQGGED